jgi:hypothetical protein
VREYIGLLIGTPDERRGLDLATGMVYRTGVDPRYPAGLAEEAS